MTDLKTKKAAELAEISKIPPLEIDPTPGVAGILLSDEITLFAEQHHLIAPFKKTNLKPAGYELTVGNEYFMSGQYMTLDSHVTIQPFEVAVIKTGERVRLPRFMIARWNIRVRHAYAGLLWVGGPQVDPGYAGYLFCPIYNLSDKPVTLYRDDELALMDFSRTTPFDFKKKENELVRYKFPPTRVILEEFNIIDFQSALFTRAGRKIEEFEESLKTLEGRFIQFTQISFAVFAMALTLLAIYSKAGSKALDEYAGYLGPLTLALSIAAFGMAFFSHWQSRLARASLDRYPAPLSQRIRDVRRFLSLSWIASTVLCLSVGCVTVFAVQFVIPRKEQSAKIGLTDKKATDALAIAKAVEQQLRRLEEENEGLRRQILPPTANRP